MRHDGSQQQGHGFQNFLSHTSCGGSLLVEFNQSVEQFHYCGDGSIKSFAAAIVVINFLNGLVQLQAQRLGCGGQFDVAVSRHDTLFHLIVHSFPHPLQETERTFHATVRPFQLLVRGGSEHHEQASGIGTELVYDGLGIDAVVLRFRHLLGAANDYRLAV